MPKPQAVYTGEEWEKKDSTEETYIEGMYTNKSVYAISEMLALTGATLNAS